MERPLEIAFHNTDHSDSVEADIRRHVDKLEQRYPHLIGCRVSVEKLHGPQRGGNAFEVHIVLAVPGRDLAVSRAPHRAKERYAHPDVHTAVRDAFDAAEKQLQSFKTRQREDAAGPSGSRAGRRACRTAWTSWESPRRRARPRRPWTTGRHHPLSPSDRWSPDRFRQTGGPGLPLDVTHVSVVGCTCKQ